jgi:hypothetical protein
VKYSRIERDWKKDLRMAIRHRDMVYGKTGCLQLVAEQTRHHVIVCAWSSDGVEPTLSCFKEPMAIGIKLYKAALQTWITLCSMRENTVTNCLNFESLFKTDEPPT